MKRALAITRKELQGYFGSPMALIFIGAFLAVTLFSFFWIDTFFARGIADVRPLFSRMPLLMIVLVAALSMRQWSEEQRSGTMEVLLTLPVRLVELVIGKFLAVVALVALALVLTLFLPISVSILGNLDWGPVIGGYIASILMASAYAAIGLYLSSKTDNQIVAFIATALVSGLFYGIGSSLLVDFFPNSVARILEAIGTGSRFSSIERGVIDLGDLLYYLSLTGIFLALNIRALEVRSWSKNIAVRIKQQASTITTILVIVNLIIVNVWVYPLQGLRLDLTENKEYTLSTTTEDLLSNLEEPLLIRGYFSDKTHPLLSPLIPTIIDMLTEYEIASGGKVQLEIIDPAEDPEKEAEANQVYGISATPFQVTDRYEASVINSYFNILFRYGDQNTVLGFNDLIEVQPARDGSIDVSLRNLEYDLTRAIKKTVYGFQSIDMILASITEPVSLTAYITPGTLPDSLADVPSSMETVLNTLAEQSNGKLQVSIVDPDESGDAITPDSLYENYGLQAIPVSFFSSDSYYLYMVLEIGDSFQVLYPTGDLSETDIRSTIESALKRASTGFLKVIGVWIPPTEYTQDMFGQTIEPLQSWSELAAQISADYDVQQVDLSSGQVPSEVDVLVLVAPENLTEKQVFAVDQFLMKGGSVIISAGNYKAIVDQYSGGLALQPLTSTLSDLLQSYGITIQNALVMDTQNEPFPVYVTREAGGFNVQEIQAVDYPFFVDIRTDNMDSDHPITANVPAVTMNWSSPIELDETLNANRDTTVLLKSTSSSWLTTDTNIQPDFNLYPMLGFPQTGDQQSYTLAVSIQGSFDSYFAGRDLPFGQTEGEIADDGTEAEPETIPPLIESSPDTARLVVFSSAEFLDDFIFQLSYSMAADRYLNSLQLFQNAIDWSVEDLDLLQIRSRGTYTRLLTPLTSQQESVWEIINYAVALVALAGLAWIWNQEKKKEIPMELEPPTGLTRESEG
ncbi:MAG: Gldg family protein [Anaerolineales bacterium]|nr:Gldg family protein [Anaerolineales bacterium]